MKILQVARIATAALAIGLGTDYAYRRYQEEPVSKYVSAQLGQASTIKSKNSNMFEFVQSLDKNYSAITNELKISEAQYKNYRNLAIGIAKEETNFGLDYSATGKKYFPKTSGFIKKIYGKLTGKGTKLSEGMTNFKITLLGKPQAKELGALKNLGVKDINKPEQSAIATIVHLNFLEKNFPVYLKNFPFDNKEQVTLNEYLVARWKGLKPSIRSIREQIISDRTAKAPKEYVGKILRSIK